MAKKGKVVVARGEERKEGNPWVIASVMSVVASVMVIVAAMACVVNGNYEWAIGFGVAAYVVCVVLGICLSNIVRRHKVNVERAILRKYLDVIEDILREDKGENEE